MSPRSRADDGLDLRRVEPGYYVTADGEWTIAEDPERPGWLVWANHNPDQRVVRRETLRHARTWLLRRLNL